MLINIEQMMKKMNGLYKLSYEHHNFLPKIQLILKSSPNSVCENLKYMFNYMK